MPKAIWNGAVIAEATADEVEIVEQNVYFPPERVRREYLKDSSHTTLCPWKGVASYYDVEVDGQLNRNAAWYYPAAKDAAKAIEGRIAFWHGVEVSR
ncbi:DUF427 domain-containing protein [Pseudoduganella sp. SL102]|uniref:DUF427 domain-containing protein n=1 Tax=Pseudoduganella albidiflava TaxID=321983 RepID=A0A411WT72_9BURK|nr:MULTISPECIES: DUF427 domain-containing protein [Pseudoduganella]QBH99873.1 DUF427 domain-containing protein [Pseudoduganella albidiflava]WBS02124.1 DUF427 domain-containing protein [Pseudoduganella sp. SL102]GGY54530.1 hypothetical protein GCM10007387_41080 [Pseudoduganella albidiflava]